MDKIVGFYMSKNHESPLYLVKWIGNWPSTWEKKHRVYAKLACEEFWSLTSKQAIMEMNTMNTKKPFVNNLLSNQSINVQSFSIVLCENQPVINYAIQKDKNSEIQLIDPKFEKEAAFAFWNQKQRNKLQNELDVYKISEEKISTPLKDHKKILETLKSKNLV